MLIDTRNLKKYLHKKKIFTYIIIESEFIFIKKNKKIILNQINKKNKFKKNELVIYKNEDWNYLYQKIQKQDLFSKKKIFSITVYDSKMSSNAQLNIKKLTNYSNQNIIIIILFPNLVYTEKLCVTIFKNYTKQSRILINNSKFYIKNINYWITEKIKSSGIKLTLSAKNFLLENSYTNIKFFSNFLEQIILLYPNVLITIYMLKKYFKSVQEINYYDWIQSIITAQKKKSINILSILKKQSYNYRKLVSIYKTLIYIILYKKENKKIENNFFDFTKYKKKIMQISLKSLIKNNDIKTIQLAFKLLKKIEIFIQKKKKKIIWMHLKTLSIILD
ncbi:hypothetical protein [Buchnera aphidicola]|uniref:DNA polymerase III subunit delta, partial n=1 Tax=Buchnera aphidicola (Cinara strobi) TaxID=1921549 RepID=A0A3B1E0Z8_9GAMM|nr:hypothetical protein [Buchnera aphidicola]VAX76705.1 DNA polymerase III subunit delta [Buchnera aphidicola (Cinara strobi)]